MTQPENKDPKPIPEPIPEKKEQKKEKEEDLPPLPLNSEWALPEKDKIDPADYGGSPWGGSNKIIPEPDGFW